MSQSAFGRLLLDMLAEEFAGSHRVVNVPCPCAVCALDRKIKEAQENPNSDITLGQLKSWHAAMKTISDTRNVLKQVSEDDNILEDLNNAIKNIDDETHPEMYDALCDFRQYIKQMKDNHRRVVDESERNDKAALEKAKKEELARMEAAKQAAEPKAEAPQVEDPPPPPAPGYEESRQAMEAGPKAGAEDLY